MNMIQTIIFVNYDIVWFYMLFQVIMCFLLKTKIVLEANMYFMFFFSIAIYAFLILYIFELIFFDVNILFVLFCCILTNFMLSLLFLDFEIKEHKILFGECPICFENGMVIELHNCKHTFHLSCIKKWMKKKRTCPLCRCQLNKNIFLNSR